MKKIINPCTVKTLKSEEVDAFCEISFENNKLRIHGVVGPILGGGCWGECGQCINDIRNGTPVDGWDVKMINRFCDTWKRWHLNDMRPECEHQRADGWRELAEKNITFYEFVLKHEFFEKRDKLKEEIIEMAKNGESISLNDDQKALLNLEDSVTLEKNHINDFYRFCRKFEMPARVVNFSGTGKNDIFAEHESPNGLLYKPCPVCGHKYDESYLKEDVPQSVIEFLFNLPDSKKTPAWI